jgi:hypothetical protein
MYLVAGFVMEGSMVFCQKNNLEHSMGFHGDYIKGYLLTLLARLIQLISEIKYIVTAANVLLSTRCAFAASYAEF